MTLKEFGYSLWPLWVLEGIFYFIAYVIPDPENNSGFYLIILFSVVSIFVAPLIAGWRTYKYSKEKAWSAWAGFSISLLSILIMFMEYVALNTETDVFFGYFLFAWIPVAGFQICFGILGCYARGRFHKYA